MQSWKRIVGVMLCAGVLFVGHAMSQDKPAPGEPGGDIPDMQTMMKKWMATVKPGPNHKWLEQFVGKWNTTTRMWMDPNAPPMETKGTAEMTMLLGGRYLQQHVKGEVLMPDQTGQMKKVPYEGMGMTGYDNYRHICVGNWQDNITTVMLTFSGQHDPAGKKLTMYGEMDEPMLDMVARHVKYVTAVENEKKFIFTIYDLAAGDNYKVLEITYERE
ncbi:hypothetical protein BH09PLA1_BH09PLA1_06130 [soil metagenome]